MEKQNLTHHNKSTQITSQKKCTTIQNKYKKLEMWANAQRDKKN